MNAAFGGSSLSRSVLIWLAVFLYAFTLRLGFAARFEGLAAPPDRAATGLDGLDYEELAYQLSVGHGFALENARPTGRRSPGFPFILAPVYVVFGRSYLAAHIFICALSAAACLPVGWLAGALAGRREAMLSSLGLASYPGHFYYSMHFLSEVPFGLELALACWLALRAWRTKSLTTSAASGFFFGVAALTRPQILLALPVIALVWFFGRTHRTVPNLRIILAHFLVVALLLVPWMVRNERVMGKATLATVVGGVTFWGSNNEFVLNNPDYRGLWDFSPEVTSLDDWPGGGAPELEMDSAGWRNGMRFVQTHWSAMPGLTVAKLWRFVTPFQYTANRTVYWTFALGWLGLVLPLLIGIVASFRRAPAETWILFAPVVGTVLSVIPFYGCIRFRDSIACVLLPLAAIGVTVLYDASRRRPVRA